MKKTQQIQCAAYLALLAVGISALHIISNPRAGGPSIALWTYGLMVVLAAGVGSGLAFLLWRSFARGEVSRRIWAYLAVGLLLCAFGEALWARDQVLNSGEQPQVSMADVLWVLGYVPLAVGLILRYRSFRVVPRRGWRLAFYWVYVAAAALAVMLLVVPVVVDGGGGGESLVRVVDALYPIGDLVLSVLALAIALVLVGGSLSRAWGLVASGFFCVAVSDLFYTLAVRQGMYRADPGGGFDLVAYVIGILYLVSYLIIDVGLYLQLRSQGACRPVPRG